MNLLQNHLSILLEFLNSLTHHVNKAFTLLVRYAQEAEVVFVCGNLVLQSLVLSDEVVTFALETVSTLVDVVAEIGNLALVGIDMECFIDGIAGLSVLLVYLVFLFERHESNAVPLL